MYICAHMYLFAYSVCVFVDVCVLIETERVSILDVFFI